MPSDPVTPEQLFECTRCGQCCQGYGGTYLSDRDMENIARYLGISRKKLAGDHCAISCGRYVLRQKADGYCIFWDGLCTIHPVKPRICRAWPFIENVLREPSNWDVMAGACPGMRTGFAVKEIVRCVRQKLNALERSRNEPTPPKKGRRAS